MSVTFAREAASVTLRNPEPANIEATRRDVPIGETEDGSVYAYKKGAGARFLELMWTELTDTERANFRAFLEDTLDGSQKIFTYTDHDASDWTARVLDDPTALDEFFNNRTEFRLRMRVTPGAWGGPYCFGLQSFGDTCFGGDAGT